MTLFDFPWVRLSVEEPSELSFGIAVAPLLFELIVAIGPRALILEIGRD